MLAPWLFRCKSPRICFFDSLQKSACLLDCNNVGVEECPGLIRNTAEPGKQGLGKSIGVRVVSSAYLKLLIFLPATLIPACVSSSPAFLMMY